MPWWEQRVYREGWEQELAQQREAEHADDEQGSVEGTGDVLNDLAMSGLNVRKVQR